MASELASMYVSITPNMSGFRSSILKELRGVDLDAGSVGTSSGNAFTHTFSRAIGGVANALGTALKVGAGAALAGIAAAGAVGVKTAAQLETAQIGFTTMLGSGEKAEAFLKDLTAFAAKTPFELPGLQQSASQLVATGIATEKVIPIMTTLGNITSGMGTGSEGIKRAVVAIQQMNAAQRITAEDLNQLRDAGVPVFELLATATGKSTKQIAEMASAGKLGKTELDALMTTLETGGGLERFSGLMEKQSQSLSGLASTAKDTFQIGMAGAIQPLIPLIKDGLGGSISWMSESLFPAVTFGLNETIGSVQAFSGAWKANDGNVTSSGMPGFFERVAFWGRQAFDGIRGALVPLRPIWDAFVGVFKELQPIFAPLIPQILGVATAFNPLGLLFKALQPVLPTIIGAFGELGAIVGGTLAQVLPVVTNVIGQLVGILAGALAQILPTIVGLIGSLSGIFGMLAPLVVKLVSAFAPLVTSIFGALVPIVTNLVNSVLPPLAVVFGSIVAAIVPLVSMLIDILVPIIQNVVVPIITVAFTVIAEVIKVAVAVILAVVSGVVSFFQDVLAPTFTWLWQNVVVPVWDGIQAIITGFLDWFSGTLMPAVGVVIDGIGAYYTWLWQNIIEPVFKTISTIIGGFVDFFRAIAEIIGAIITTVLAPIFNWLWQNVMVPVWDGIMTVINAAWNWINDNVFKPIGVALGIMGTAFDFLWKNVIAPVWKGIQDAIGGAWNWIRDSVFTPLTDFIQKTIPAAFEAGKDAIGRAWELIRDVVKAPIKFVIETIINNGIIGAINTVRGWFQMDKLPPVALPAGFATGGYTGRGGVNDPAGIVHAGEIVWSQADINRWGGVGIVEALRTAKGYAGGGLVSPLDNYVLTQGFSGILGHNGIDMAAPTGTPIHAAGPGRVSFAGWSVFGGGNETHIDHPNGLQTWYAHQNSFNVGNGANVSQGQTIGTVGSTGFSSGPHLHYMVLDGGWPFVLNPMDYLSGGGNPGSNPMAAFINPLAGLLDGFLASVRGAFPGAGEALEMAVGFVKKTVEDAMKGIGDMIAGTNDGGGPGGRTRGPFVTEFDNGGWLERTASPVLTHHKRRDPDAVLRNREWQNIHVLAEKAMQEMGKGEGSAREQLDGAQLELVGVNAFSDSIIARIRLAWDREI